MFESILWILFVLACLVVSVVILLQEGKGGGLGEAFGGAGQQTFGVKAEGINRFTGYVSIAVVLLAIVITRLRSDSSGLQFTQPAAPTPAEQGAPVAPGTSAPATGAPATGAPAPAGQAPTQSAPPASALAPAPAPAQTPTPAPTGGDKPAGGGGQ